MKLQANLFTIIGLTFCVFFTMSETGARAEDSEECKACKEHKIQARWQLRQDCLDPEGETQGDETSCNGPNSGETCCHCTKSPDEDPKCWNETCNTECWASQCAEECPTEKHSVDVPAGPIYSNDNAKTKCPGVCQGAGKTWNGQWTTVASDNSVCGCQEK